jgi:DNA-binding SARP family transcriptional activator
MPGFLDQPVRTALLILLAVEKEITREKAMALLWPESEPEKARHALNQTVYRLRKDLGDDWLEAKGERLRITEAVSIDVHLFQAALDGGHILEALDIYDGPFLAGWAFPGTGQFESWVDRVRIQLSRSFRKASRDRVATLRDEEELSEALAIARRWADADPLDDEAQHCLIELLVETGDRAEALNRFDAFERLLALDDLEPLDNTLALVQAIREKKDTVLRNESLSHASRPPPADPEPEVAHGPLEAGRRWSLRRIGIAAGVGIVLLSVVGFWLLGLASGEPELVENRVLVLPLENQTGNPDLDPIGRMAADWISQGLSGAGFVEVVPTIEVIPELQREQEGSGGEALSQALDWAQENHAGNVVYGAYYQREEGLEFHLQIATVATGTLLHAIGPVASQSEDPMLAVDVLRQRAMIAMAVHFDVLLEGLLEKATLPPSYESYLAYTEGYEAFGRGRFMDAIVLLEESNSLSPGFTAPLIVAGFARANLGDYAAAESLAVVVRASAESLTPYDRYRLDFLESKLRGDREASLRATRAAAALQPGGSAHAAAGGQALSLNRPREALELLATFNRNGAAAAVYTPLWNTLTTAHHALGEHRQELAEAQLGRQVQPYSLAVLAYEIRALAALGRVDQVAERLEECVNFSPDVRGWTPPDAMLMASRELRAHGQTEASSRAVEKALAWYSGRPAEEQRSGSHRRGLARALFVAERWNQAQGIFEELEADSPGSIEYVGYLGVLAARLGESDLANHYDERLAGLESAYLFGSHSLWRSRISAQLGDREGSLNLLRTALSQGAAFPFALLHTGADFDPLRDHPSFQEILRPKG